MSSFGTTNPLAANVLPRIKKRDTVKASLAICLLLRIIVKARSMRQKTSSGVPWGFAFKVTKRIDYREGGIYVKDGL
jgi:hypothetical protein